MIKILNPQSHSTTVRTAEIMSRYRPIAPKPESAPSEDAKPPSSKINQSPYLRNLWPQLQARPTRTRKRGRASVSPVSLKRPRTAAASHALGLLGPNQRFMASSAKNLSFQAFAHAPRVSRDLVTLPLLPCSPSVARASSQVKNDGKGTCMELKGEEKGIDLNKAVEAPEERDFLQQLIKGPITTNGVIAPQPVRPVGSSISVGPISENPGLVSPIRVPKRREEVEREVESEVLPAVVTDANNRVRLANSAYREMVGQPECQWLESMLASDSCKRICGEVVLRLCNSVAVPVSSSAFSCWARIVWGTGDKRSVDAFCDVNRLVCQSPDYAFTWRFHTNIPRDVSRSSCSEELAL